MSRRIPKEDVSTREVLAYLGLVIGLSWLQFVPSVLSLSFGISLPDGLRIVPILVFVLSPALSAVVLVAWRSNPLAAIAFLRERFTWRVSRVWYLAAVTLFPLILATASIAYSFLGGPLVYDRDSIIVTLFEVVSIGFVTNLSENYGWRGYLQEGLQSTQSALAASLTVGVVWGVWHAPLFFVEEGPLSPLPYSWYTLLIVGVAVIFGWLYNETGGSVLLVTILHSSFNLGNGVILLPVVDTGADLGSFIGIVTVVVWVVVGVILYRGDSMSLTPSR